MLACAAAYALLLYKPGLYFNQSLDYRLFTLRARGTLPSGIQPALDSAMEKISASEIYKDGMRFEIILPETKGQFRFFTPFVKGDYFRVNPFNGAIFLASADFEAGEARTEPGLERYRSLSSIVTAAAALEMTRRRLRPLTYLSMSEWKARGYSELLSGGSGEFNPPDACAGGDRPGLEDYTYGLMLDTVLKQENAFYSDLLDRNYSRQNAEIRVRKAYCGE